jgi:hypothetical protein
MWAAGGAAKLISPAGRRVEGSHGSHAYSWVNPAREIFYERG